MHLVMVVGWAVVIVKIALCFSLHWLSLLLHVFRRYGTEPFLLWYSRSSKHHDPWDGPHLGTVPCLQGGEREGLLWWSVPGNTILLCLITKFQAHMQARLLEEGLFLVCDHFVTTYSILISFRRPPHPWKQEIYVLTLHQCLNPKCAKIPELSATPVVSSRTRAHLITITWVTQVKWMHISYNSIFYRKVNVLLTLPLKNHTPCKQITRHIYIHVSAIRMVMK